MTEEWYAPRDIVFNKIQMGWLISWLPTIEQGRWPADPRGTGYTDVPSGKKTRNRHAPFETPSQIAAEVKARLDACGSDGDIILLHYYGGWEMDRIARLVHMEEREAMRRVNRALNYISSGFCRRWLNCIDCVYYSDCKRKKKVGISYSDWAAHRQPAKISAFRD